MCLSSSFLFLRPNVYGWTRNLEKQVLARRLHTLHQANCGRNRRFETLMPEEGKQCCVFFVLWMATANCLQSEILSIEELLGHLDHRTEEWDDGLVPLIFSQMLNQLHSGCGNWMSKSLAITTPAESERWPLKFWSLLVEAQQPRCERNAAEIQCCRNSSRNLENAIINQDGVQPVDQAGRGVALCVAFFLVRWN